MYKVFIYNKPVYIGVEGQIHEKNCQQFTELNVDKIIESCKDSTYDGVLVNVESEKWAWKAFKNYFKYIKAAGGVVENQTGEILSIYRLDCWDLPKGKLEKDEDVPNCALREVEEECGVNDLTITKELSSTYHCYFHKEKWVLKRTYWFHMNTGYNGQLIPQQEEGITQVEWIKREDLNEKFESSYGSIKDVINQYLAQ